MLGMLAGLEKKNCWTIAEHRGQVSPEARQHVLWRAKGDADAVRGDLCSYGVDHFAEDNAVLVVEETGDLKKGVHSVGVQRQYTGTAGRIENAQIAVYLTYAAPRGHVPYPCRSGQGGRLGRNVPGPRVADLVGDKEGKGHRNYSWAWVELLPNSHDPADRTGRHHLLIRRNDPPALTLIPALLLSGVVTVLAAIALGTWVVCARIVGAEGRSR